MTDRELSKISAIFTRWQRSAHMRLHAGEMTAQEIRTVRAVLGAVSVEVLKALADHGECAEEKK